MAGITAAGLVKKTFDDILTELQDSIQNNTTVEVNFDPDSQLGMFLAVTADALRDSWDLAEAVYASQYPDTSGGAALAGIGAITGSTFNPATRSTVDCFLNLDGSTSVTVGSVMSASDVGTRWLTASTVTNSDANPNRIAVTLLSEDFGAVFSAAGAIDTIETAVAGWEDKAMVVNTLAETYALTGGETLTVSVDGAADQTVTILAGDITVGFATAAEVAAKLSSALTGATSAVAASGTTIYIESDTAGEGSGIQVTGGTANAVLSFPTTAFSGVNLLDPTLGSDAETDAAFRLRRENSLRLAGASALEPVRAAILDVAGVTECKITENTTESTVDSIPMKSFEAVCVGGTDLAIAQAIFDKKPLGIRAFGLTGTFPKISEAIVDSQGNVHTIEASRQDDVDLWLIVELTGVASRYGGGDKATGDTLVKETLATLGDTLLTLGTGFTNVKYKCELLDEVSGITDITAIKVDSAAFPTLDQNFAAGPRERLVLDTTRITVVSTLS